MRALKSRTTIVIAVLAVALTVAVIFGFLYTPTITLRIENDTAQQLTLTGCSSDAVTLDPAQVVDIDPNAGDPHAACIVLKGKTREVLGCLPIPTTRYRNHATVELNTYQRGTTPSSC